MDGRQARTTKTAVLFKTMIANDDNVSDLDPV
jgi:hypothetical protein